jgi:predicted dehydrogenase/carbonic anhydrase/acetyltransferase-like protein (isoleucine patch superfamily)
MKVWGKMSQDNPKIAVVGCGYWGKNLVRNFAQIGHLCAVSDDNKAQADKFAAEYDVPAMTYDQILNSDDIDGVVLATPASMHAQMGLDALEAGKHVFVEKPLALDVEDARKMVQASTANEKVLMVGHLLQYHPAFLRVKKLMRDGELGRLQYIYSNRLNFGKIRQEENVFWSFAPHDISMILGLAGSLPETVHTQASHYLHKDVADTTVTHLTFADGLNAHIFVSWLHPFKEQKLVIIGTEGMLTFTDNEPWDKKLQLYKHKVVWKDGLPEPAKADPIYVPLEEDEPLKLECQHFVDCIKDGEMPNTDGAEGLRVLRVLNASEESANSGEAIRLSGMSAKKKELSAVKSDNSPISHSLEDVFVHETALVDDGVHIGAGSKIWHFSHILAGTTMGANCVVGQNAMVGPSVTIGNGCKIQNNVSLYKGVQLEDDVFCGPSCVFTNVLNPRAFVERKDEFKPTPVGRGATIGANATIVCGNKIGAYAMVGAGAVVTRDVAPHSLVVGVPARHAGWVSHEGEILGDDLTCPRTGDEYTMDAQGALVLKKQNKKKGS